MEKNIIKIGKFEFMILVIIDNSKLIAISIGKELSKRFKSSYSRAYMSKILKKLREAGLIKVNKRVYTLTKNGEYYLELYNKL